MSVSLREHVRQRAGGCCEYCQMPDSLDSLPFQWDHIIAIKHGGPTDLANLAWSCFACNNHKQSDLTGVDRVDGGSQIVRLFHPRSDRWHEHFTWQGPQILGRTAIGRVTVYVLGINLPHRVALRQLLIDEGSLPV
jgi:HNH endonuclease